MKKIAITISLLFSFVLSGPIYSQNTTHDKETRKQKKKEQIQKDFEHTRSLLESKQFVLEADWLGNQYGERVPVTSLINFIMVDSSDAVVQIGSNYGFGNNGVGGVTANGPLTTWELNSNAKKNYFNLRMIIMSNIGTYDILMNISADGHATAIMTGIGRGKLTYTGNIIPIQDSYVFQGHSSY